MYPLSNQAPVQSSECELRGQEENERRKPWAASSFFFLFLLCAARITDWQARTRNSCSAVWRGAGTASRERSSRLACSSSFTSSSSVIVFSFSCSATFLLSSSSFFCGARAFVRRNRRVRPSLASADGSANDGTPRRSVSREERRRLRTRLCGPCASCTTSSSTLANF